MNTFYLTVTSYDRVHNEYFTEAVDIIADSLDDEISKYKNFLPYYASLVGVNQRF